jgi:uncharacterized protein YbbK (DUF523 family)
MKLVSACLIGIHCRFDGKDSLDNDVQRLVKEGKAVPVCPEQMGGLSTPRLPAEIVGGDGDDVLDGKAKVINIEGEDVTEAFIRGAEEALRAAKSVGATEAILKEKSPSCGSCVIYDGTFKGQKQAGSGVTAALLKRNGIHVVSDEMKRD